MKHKNKNIRNVTRCLNTLLFSFVLIFLSSCGSRKSLQEYLHIPKAKPFNVSKVIVTASSCSGIQENVSISEIDYSWKHVIYSPAILLFEIVLGTPEKISIVPSPTSERCVSGKVPLFIVYRKMKLLA